MLTLVKTVHTLIWAVMASAILYTLYAGIMNLSGPLLWLSIGLVLLESTTLALNKMTCPLTPIAGKYTSDRRANFDIYLPEWLAKHNKLIFGALFVVALLLVARNLLID